MLYRYRSLNFSAESDHRTDTNTRWYHKRCGEYTAGLPQRRQWLLAGSVLLLLVILWEFSRSEQSQKFFTSGWNAHIAASQDGHQVTMVVASMKGDDTSWLADYRSEWDKKVYVTDDITAPFSVPINKGREAMVYLTYIIDHYDELAPVTIFHHAARYQWHNDDPLYDGRRMLDRLQIAHILKQGYVNLRCVWTLGCPIEIRPLADAITEHTEGDSTASYYAEAYAELFPATPMPALIGVSCCAQFATSRTQIRARQLNDYVRYRNWLLATDIPDHVSGRIFEYSWHMVFGMKPVFCPDAKSCYCQVYGLCNIACETEGTCASQYTLARYSTLPVGWPEIGWDGETRNVTRLREEQEGDFTPT